MTPAEQAVLNLLRNEDGPISCTEATRRLGLTWNGTHAALLQLREQGKASHTGDSSPDGPRLCSATTTNTAP